ncbi:hypothetical protein BDR03DRAFT_935724 [Suillus americanus]|nr:hypothetical protein BDR03DRAFT_935724 [Suillus americanus]
MVNASLDFSRSSYRAATDDPLHLWNSDVDLFLLEFICLEGHGDFAQAAYFCGEADCHGAELVCLSCTLHIHERQLLHRIELQSCSTTTLKALGACFQLGHPISSCCTYINFCRCESAQLHITQLLCVCLFPTTILDPKSAATFCMLEYFQMLSFESKVLAWEFYNTIACLMDKTGTRVLKMIREWHFVMQMKRYSQSHHSGGIQATEAGACAILCPACPHPSRNLPVGWENYPPEFQVWCNVSSDAIDLGLNHRYTFFVEETTYKDFLASHYGVGNLQENSTCSSHSAVNLADMRASHGLVAMGAGTISNNCVQLVTYKKEKDIHVLNISYDIACQWNKNLWSHMLTFPYQYHINHNHKVVTFLVPKFHLSAHIASFQMKFLFNFIKGVG